MIHPDLFDLLNIIMKRLRKREYSHLPFGGMQVVICGDFYQLPPVVKKKRVDSDFIVSPVSARFQNRTGNYGPSVRKYTSSDTQQFEETPYLFESEAWTELMESGMETVQLSNVFRQTETEFLDILDETRRGQFSKKSWAFLNGHRNKAWPQDGILVSLLRVAWLVKLTTR
jgi:hypothetical protein